jgi:hypothetical protein
MKFIRVSLESVGQGAQIHVGDTHQALDVEQDQRPCATGGRNRGHSLHAAQVDGAGYCGRWVHLQRVELDAVVITALIVGSRAIPSETVCA